MFNIMFKSQLTIIEPIGDGWHCCSALEHFFVRAENHCCYVATVAPAPNTDSWGVEIAEMAQQVPAITRKRGEGGRVRQSHRNVLQSALALITLAHSFAINVWSARGQSFNWKMLSQLYHRARCRTRANYECLMKSLASESEANQKLSMNHDRGIVEALNAASW